jgi:ProP effector
MTRDNQSPLSSSKSLRDKVQPTLALLRERFPKAFVSEDKSPLPLQVGILQELFVTAKDISRRQLRWAVYYYANNIRYQQALIEGGPRYDLEGQPVGEVTDDHRKDAVSKMEEIKPKSAPQNSSKRSPQKTFQARGKSRFPYQKSRPTQSRPASSGSAQPPAVIVRQRKSVASATPKAIAKPADSANSKSAVNRGVLSLRRRVAS